MQELTRLLRGGFGRLGTKRERGESPPEYDSIRCILWAMGGDYDIEEIRQSTLHFNEALRRLALQRGRTRSRRRSDPARISTEEAISSLVASRYYQFQEIRRSFPELLPEGNDNISERITDLLVRGGLDELLESVRKASSEDFEVARGILRVKAPHLMGIARLTLTRIGIGLNSKPQKIVLRLAKKKLLCFPVYVAAYVHKARKDVREVTHAQKEVEDTLIKEWIGVIKKHADELAGPGWGPWQERVRSLVREAPSELVEAIRQALLNILNKLHVPAPLFLELYDFIEGLSKEDIVKAIEEAAEGNP